MSNILPPCCIKLQNAMIDQKIIISGYKWLIKECVVHSLAGIKFCPFCGTKLPAYRKLKRKPITEKQKELF